ncbi:hypothetical protein E1B28_004932 [Marasmius oreades]|uniref:Uncharacterized protein n=1 Tax=Marasmius oreades TaxID=181124 RepID=A0A9P7UZK0_9AGAR|nr:uncharacterized protein E1B28_004932 [Marasmius oreades]KAG7097596.1 hypothetical protein E1B28_004932 [Marasmius oreades]
MESQGWASIRPWIPPLTLSVREITSVSVTFILSASSAPLPSDPDLSALGLSAEDVQHRVEDEPDVEDEDEGHSTSNSESDAKSLKSPSSHPSVVSRALAGGLSVEVDRGLWRRVLIRIDDKADEAVIIVYGLMPGRQYDVDLELVQGQTMRSQVVTQEDSSPNGTAAELEMSTAPTGNADDSTPSRPTTPPPKSSPSPSQSNSSQPHPQSGTSFSFAPLTLEDRITQLQHTLSLLNSDTATLTASIKSTRRDSQKADAALRSEIEVLRRASEKHAAGELRMKQKVLALQEAVKRTNTFVTETKSEFERVDELYPKLESTKNTKEKEYERVLAEADRMREAREREEEKVRKRIEGFKTELNALAKTHEKLEAKQEKIENGTVKELQDKLELVERELEELEAQEKMYSMLNASNRPFASSGSGLGPIGQPRPQIVPELPITFAGRPPAGPVPIQRPANSSSTPITSTKSHMHNHSLPLHPHNFVHQTSSNAPGQRPQSLSSSHVSHHSHPSGPHSSHGLPHLGGGGRQSHHHAHGHHDRSHTAVPTTILVNPNRANRHSSSGSTSTAITGAGVSTSLPSTPMVNANSTTTTAATTDSGSEGSGGSPGQAHMSAVKLTGGGTSTLSSRAAPFEPSKGLGMGPMGFLRGTKSKNGGST